MQLAEIQPSMAARLISKPVFGFDPMAAGNAVWFTNDSQSIVVGVILMPQYGTWRFAIVASEPEGPRWLGGGFSYATIEDTVAAVEAKSEALGIE